MITSYNIERFFQLLYQYDIPGLSKIRLGKDNDGGYVVAKELLENRDLYSFGVGDDASFEKSFMNFSCGQVKAFDPTIDSVPDDNIQFEKKGIGLLDPHHKLDSFINRHIPHIIKMDVEGYEWPALTWDDIFCDQLIIEFHLMTVQYSSGGIYRHTPYFAQMYKKFYDEVNEDLFGKYALVLDKILNGCGYTLFHMHGNNSLRKVQLYDYEFPPLIECTFVRDTFVPQRRPSGKIHPVPGLDRPNKIDRPDFDSLLPFKHEPTIQRSST